MVIHYFEDKLINSMGKDKDNIAVRIIKKCQPDAEHIYRAGSEDDKRGADYYSTVGDKRTNYDFKFRSIDPIDAYNSNDILVEIYSSTTSHTPGWTVAPDKITDYVVYYFEPTGRYLVYDYKLLRETVLTNYDHYNNSFNHKFATTKTDYGYYTTENIAVPVEVINQDMAANRALSSELVDIEQST